MGCRIADPEATKPEDWDEDAPREIPDEEAEKPKGWLDDEPLEIDDPGALRPAAGRVACMSRSTAAGALSAAGQGCLGFLHSIGVPS